eukprot:CAMPEP_0181183576 /NCGR_PEP_ID=MMETSP1096-20121128/8500_1 /TAXON_ID=156174 ORGANISM="Chrysochromulina ericina, Strain CCMP281" /NCGR_SAMPLE_ID=MMETSP1096 /ASSEMBLY_ACC=CAM_ASM_000453 /LENGTH=101 /DNA_ID=CAMNT_0023272267 /DNA_START=178 /DNA_END=483 /DNA_ORIENTATION=+
MCGALCQARVLAVLVEIMVTFQRKTQGTKPPTLTRQEGGYPQRAPSPAISTQQCAGGHGSIAWHPGQVLMLGLVMIPELAFACCAAQDRHVPSQCGVVAGQ